jgi:hypothetical protein
MAEIIAIKRGEPIVDAQGFPTLRFLEYLEFNTRFVNQTGLFVDTVLIDGVQPTVTTIQTLYTSPSTGAGTRVVAFTATNNSGGAATYDLHIVPNGGTADATNKLVNARSLATTASDNPEEVIEQVIPRGGTLEVKVSVGTTIAFRATGNEL